ncbi:hypothetical protein Moror_17582 [Moniliophthora roreri MCA 2997]|uniref:Uncharacterized protein n=1 Tax=Moniliophthora roreri (strain MCA 2997) TaxID=1381753 RepID=V2XUX7_MONRO|nr:hypothetical protein Moror_17582 [Moniliophthora roreri MCA 2997]
MKTFILSVETRRLMDRRYHNPAFEGLALTVEFQRRPAGIKYTFSLRRNHQKGHSITMPCLKGNSEC